MNELYINGIEVPLDSNFGIDYVKEIADIENPDQRRSDYSNSIRIVGTKEVNKLFNHIYDINVYIDPDSSFYPQKKADAVYYEDSIEQLRGFFRLVSIEVDNDVIIYNGTLHGELSNIFKDMGDSLISDLDWTDLNHTYNETSIRNSWAGVYGAPGSGFFYPMVDYKGYAAPNPLVLGVDDFRPAVWFIDIWNRIFSQYGYTYDSAFIDGTTGSSFDRLLMPSKSEVITLTAQQITDRSFDVGLTAEWVYPQDKYGNTLWIGFDDDTTGALYNTINNDYGITGQTLGRFTCSLSGTYVANINLDTQIEYTGATGTLPAALEFPIYKIKIKRIRGGGTTTLSEQVVSTTWPQVVGAPLVTNDRTNVLVVTNTQSFEVIEGDQVYVTMERMPLGNVEGSSSIYDSTEWSAVIGVASTWGMTYDDNVLTVGTSVDVSGTVPKMKQKDFIMGVVKAFNLYIEQTSEKNLLVEPRDVYYTDDAVDWTNKKNGGIKIEPNKNLQGKQYNFKFEKDKDFLHEKYLDEIGADYGDLLLAFDDDFKTEIKEIQLPFGSTLITGLEDTNDIPVASLFYDGLYPNSNEGETKPRMLYYGGMIGCVAWTFATGGVGAETTYPYVGDTWSPYGVLNTSNELPSILNFQRPEVVYYDGNPTGVAKDVAYGGRSLYSQYSQMIADIQNPVISCKMYLNPMDIYNLSFRKKYFIDTAYFRLLKLSKQGNFYNCEFLKIE